MVELGRISRSGFYRFEKPERRENRDMDLRDAMHKVALEWPTYGRPRMTRELQRRGWEVGETRVRRLMREDNLLCVRKRKFVITTDSNHGRKVYPNLARNMILTGTDQLWIADITYIRLREEFVFLAVILDRYSRRVIGAIPSSKSIRAAQSPVLALSIRSLSPTNKLRDRRVAQSLRRFVDDALDHLASAFDELDDGQQDLPVGLAKLLHH